MEIRYSKTALKALARIDKTTAQRITIAITGLTTKPPQGDIKPLKGTVGEYRLRVGQYRVLYYYTNENSLEILVVYNIGARGDIYK